MYWAWVDGGGLVVEDFVDSFEWAVTFVVGVKADFRVRIKNVLDGQECDNVFCFNHSSLPRSTGISELPEVWPH